MTTEIERKFLVKNDNWKQTIIAIYHYRQWYLTDANASNSIRISYDTDTMIAEMCTKTTDLESRLEFEYEIPINDALQMENMRIGYLISKTRYHIIDEFNQQWEIDIFDDNNAGLVIAELEIPFVSTKIQLPPWVSTEVTHNHKFYNAWLATCPFEYWINRDEILGELNDGSR